MAWRRPSWHGSCLVGRLAAPPRRCFTQLHARASPSRPLSKLDCLLQAVQRQDLYGFDRLFVAWTDSLSDASSPSHAEAVRQAQELPGPTLSEILRCLDPLVSSPYCDAAHGLHISPGQTYFTNAGELLDQFGVRLHHGRLVSAIHTLLAVRATSQRALAPADYEVFLRCAGAALDLPAAKSFWASMADAGLARCRTTKTWTEFIKARFVTEPLYYQYDRARVAVLARDLYSNRSRLPMASLKRLDAMRLSINARKREPWNRRPDEPSEDLRRILRRRQGFRAYKNHWIRALYYGHEMDEELLCASMIAFARSSSLHCIKTLILQTYYGLRVHQAPDGADVEISGGFELPPNSPIRPTARLLNAIVEALGAMSQIRLATKLVDFIAQRYQVAIPPATWSNLLAWTYLCASKPFRSMRRLCGPWPSTLARPADVRRIWETMTSPRHQVQPSFDDYNLYLKTLIMQRAFGQALDIIRHSILPYYHALCAEHHEAVLEELLHLETAAPVPRLALRRAQAQLRKDQVHHAISSWFAKLLKTVSQLRAHRDGPLTRVLIPQLLQHYADFFPDQVHYRTAQGAVRLERPEAVCRFRWHHRWRTTLPQKMAGFRLGPVDASDAPDFPYPYVPALTILESRRVPVKRRPLASLGPLPSDPAAAKRWRASLEDELRR